MKPYDSQVLYRQYNRLIGIQTRECEEINIDNWLNPNSPSYNKTLADAIFHYSPRAKANQRFEVCISTPEMKAAAWKYAYKSQIILDSTFGVCTRKLLLLIVMGVDEKSRCVPLAFLLFSAPSGNKTTSSGYDMTLLTRLLQVWRMDMEKTGGKPFEVLVAITNTDLKERAALVQVFSHIWLLLCKFHIRQSWRNHRNKKLKGKTPVLIDIKNRMQVLERSLIQTTAYGVACALVQKERGILTAAINNNDSGSAAKRGLEHLEYLEGYWLKESLWQSWSDFGCRAASQILGCTLEGVLPTTNHLESFNGVLKWKHLQRWNRGGCRL